MSFEDASTYQPVNGDQITGSPVLLSKYISAILGKGAHFQYIDGDTIEVIVAGAGQEIANAFGDVNVAAKPEAAPEPEVESQVELSPVVELSPAEDLAPVEEAIVDPTPAPAKRGRKPAAPKVEAEAEVTE